MLSHPALSKIQPDHLDREAVISVRQSSLMQVRDNTTSPMRQYDLVQRALSLGWAQEHIQVIDQDQAHSGSSTIGRDGFQSTSGSSRAQALRCALESGSLASRSLLQRLVSPLGDRCPHRHARH
jgi:hypothetical protein